MRAAPAADRRRRAGAAGGSVAVADSAPASTTGAATGSAFGRCSTLRIIGERSSRARDIKNRDREGMRDHIMNFPSNSSSFLNCGVLAFTLRGFANFFYKRGLSTKKHARKP